MSATWKKYRPLEPLEHIEPGDEFSWKIHFDDGADDWYPCESFVGRRVESITRSSNVTFRRPLAA